MPAPQYSPIEGYGAQSGSYNFVQTPTGPTWSTVPQSQATGGSVLGSNTTSKPASNNSSGGSSSNNSNNNNNKSNQDADAFLKEIDNAFNSTNKYLDQAGKQLSSDLKSTESDVNNLYGASRNSLDAEKNTSYQQLNTQEQQGGQRKEDAVTAARRLYNELVTGGQQRFGGASSAGEAYQSLAGRELQRNNAGIQQNFENFQQQVAVARQNVQQRYEVALQTLEAKKIEAVNNIRRDFQNKMLEISRLRGENESAKQQARLGALQDLRNQVFQIQLAEAQSRQNITALRSNLENELTSYAQNASGQVDSAIQFRGGFEQNAPVDPRTSMAYSGGLGQGQQQYQGSVNPRDELLPIGAITPRQEFLA